MECPLFLSLVGEVDVFQSLVLVSCLLLGQAAGEVQSSSEDLANRVRQLVRQLDARELAQREAAEKALVELGPPVLEVLPPVTPQMPAEVKQRLERIVGTVQKIQAEQGTQASTVTLNGSYTLQEVFEELERQTGNKIVGYENRSAQLELALENVSYWEALDKVLDEAGLTINRFGGTRNALTVAAAPEEAAPRKEGTTYNGIFRFQATRIEAVRDLINPRIQGMRVTLSISWEPRITPILLTQPVEQITAVLATGEPLPLDSRPTQLSAAVESSISAAEIDLPFPLPPREAEQIATLQGTITALVPSRLETFEFDQLQSIDQTQQTKAGVTVILEEIRKNLALHEVRVRVRFDDPANALESHRGWIYNNEAYMIGPSGERIENAGFQATRQESNEVGVAYLFAVDEGLDQYKFVYKTPALIVQMPVSYELKNIALP